MKRKLIVLTLVAFTALNCFMLSSDFSSNDLFSFDIANAETELPTARNNEALKIVVEHSTIKNVSYAFAVQLGIIGEIPTGKAGYERYVDSMPWYVFKSECIDVEGFNCYSRDEEDDEKPCQSSNQWAQACRDEGANYFKPYDSDIYGYPSY